MGFAGVAVRSSAAIRPRRVESRIHRRQEGSCCTSGAAHAGRRRETNPRIVVHGWRRPSPAAAAAAGAGSLAPADANAGTEPTTALTASQRACRTARFWSGAVPIFAAYIAAIEWLKLKGAGDGERDRVMRRLHAWGSKRLHATISDLRGFYVKTGQIISTRVDLFPLDYTTLLSELQDRVDPLPADVVKQVVSEELALLRGNSGSGSASSLFSDVFSSFDEVPLGSASIAQVHRATLREGGKVVAVKVMRPHIEHMLRADIQNVIQFAKTFRDQLPLDYFLVFSELAERMEDELDFRTEAEAMDDIYDLLHRSVNGNGKRMRRPALQVPHSVRGLVTRRVLVMDYMDGLTLAQIDEQNRQKRSSKANAGEAQSSSSSLDEEAADIDAVTKLVGGKLIRALTEGFGQMVIRGGLFHGDPHPGNIMVLKNGETALLDFGQTKRLSETLRNQLCELCLLLEQEGEKDYESISRVVEEMGVKVVDGADKYVLSACAIWMFDSLSEMPGGYSADELSENSPVRKIASFPQDLVMVGRSAVLIRGICAFFSIPWSVSRAWVPWAKWRLHGTPIREPSVIAQRVARVLQFIQLAFAYVSSLVARNLAKLRPKKVPKFFRYAGA